MSNYTLDPNSFKLSRSDSQKSPLQKILAYGSLLLIGTGIGVGGTYLLAKQPLLEGTIVSSVVGQKPQTTPVNSEGQISIPTNFVTQVVQTVGPAVVRIESSRTVKTQVPEMFNDPFFRQFFGNQTPHFPDQQIQRGMGSGFIFSADGNILTNAHVVDGAEEVTVTLKNGDTYKGRVLGSDSVTDLAVVKIEANNLPTIELGNSDNLQVGEWAIAIGNPLGLDNTVTTGIISAVGRNSSQIGEGDKRIDFIQTDAAINPGNSGGPLLNAQGEVIGINTAIIQNAQGIGFAIPINKAQEISQQLISQGKVEHPYLGIRMAEITPELKQELAKTQGWTMNADSGVVIVEVVPNSPAAQGGLIPGDVIKAIDGESVGTASKIQQIVENTKVGTNLPLQVERQGKTLNLSVEVGVLPKQNSSTTQP